MSNNLHSALVAEVAGRISGSLLGPRDAGYESARAVHNGVIDRKPALIVRCRTTCDVVEAIALARAAALEASIRGGGHTVEGGVVWGELNDAAAEHGLTVTGGTCPGRV